MSPLPRGRKFPASKAGAQTWASLPLSWARRTCHEISANSKGAPAPGLPVWIQTGDNSSYDELAGIQVPSGVRETKNTLNKNACANHLVNHLVGGVFYPLKMRENESLGSPPRTNNATVTPCYNTSQYPFRPLPSLRTSSWSDHQNHHSPPERRRAIPQTDPRWDELRHEIPKPPESESGQSAQWSESLPKRSLRGPLECSHLHGDIMVTWFH